MLMLKGLEEYPEIVRIVKGKEEKNQWGENWHSDVSYNSKPTKAVILKSLKYLLLVVIHVFLIWN